MKLKSSFIFFSLVTLFIILWRIIFGDADLVLQFFDGPLNASEWEGKVVWITGASSGFGREMALQLAPFKPKLILTARRLNELEKLQQELIESGHLFENDIFVLPADLAEIDTLQEKATQALHKWNRIDILINNAGISARCFAMNCSFDVEQKVFNVNYHAATILSKAVLPSMIKNKYGKLVQISSLAGKVGLPLRSTYSASKAAMLHYFEVLQAENLDNGIHVINICPGFVATNMSAASLGPNGKPIGKVDSKLTFGLKLSRAVHLCLVAIENCLLESWVAQNPELFLTYLCQYTPALKLFLYQKFAPEIIKHSLALITDGN